MEVIKAKTAGFCMGVGLALRRLEEALKEHGQGSEATGGCLYTLGPIIHNPQLVREYEEQGAICLHDPARAQRGDTVVIRAHGLPCEVEESLRGRGVKIVDATCPKVKSAQVNIRRAFEAGKGDLLLFGESEHPEVRGLLSYAGPGSKVFGGLEELRALGLKAGDHYFLAAQTTQDKSIFTDIEKYVRTILGEDITVLKTICDATRERQDEVIRLSGTVRSMVIVGGLNSGNTTRLAEIAKARGVFTVHCENGNNLPLEKLKGLQPVGLSAGASTPDKQILEIEDILNKA